MGDNKSNYFFVKSKIHSPGIPVCLIHSHTKQEFGPEIFEFRLQ